MSAERIEAQLTVPASTTVSASNSGGGATTVTTTAGATYLTSLLTDLQTQLNTSRAPSSGSWTVTSDSTTGRVSINCTGSASIPSFSLDWTSTALRDFLGFAANINYPTTADLLESALGYGDFTNGAGYLCNESSGDLASTFGSPATLTAASSPVYGNTGPRGGPDKALSFDSAADCFTGGVSDFNVSGTDDLVIAWVGQYTTSSTTGRVHFVKGNSGSARWTIYRPTGSTNLRIEAVSASGVVTANVDVSTTIGSWHVGIAVIDRAAGVCRVGVCVLGGSPLVSSTSALFAGETLSNADAFSVGGRGGASASTDWLLAGLYVASGASVAASASANLSTALSNFAATFGAWTGPSAAKGLWIPGCPIALDGDPKQAPKGDDGGATIGPTGGVYGLSSSHWYQHRNVRFSHVAKSKVWSTDATYDNEDWETFYLDTQRGQHSWFAKFAPLKIYWDNAGTATQLGNGTVSSWTMPQPLRLHELNYPVASSGGGGPWTGLVEIRLGDLFSAT